MIHDPASLSLAVESDDTRILAETSVSLGLVVTELVINAIKHGFPDGRRGAIVVGFHAEGSTWALSVRDDGVGMPGAGEPRATPGLGTSIVEALARQLDARVQLDSTDRGTRVRLIHGLAEIAAPTAGPAV